MSDIVFEAPPRNGESIERLADAIRETFGLEDETFFPIVEFVEKGLPLLVDGLDFDDAVVAHQAGLGPVS